MINKIILQGRLTKDVEIETVNGFSKAKITVAWSEEYKETKKQFFLNCEAWRGTADFLAKYFKKGQEIVIEGQMITSTWEKDGQKQSRSFCNIEKVNFCGPKSNNGSSDNPPSSGDDFMTIPDNVDEELPFK